MLSGFWFGVGHALSGPLVVAAAVIGWAVGLVIFGTISRLLKRWRRL